jgi:phytoene dehydrogenase-like protein
MNQVNQSKLKDPKLVQLFNRFATYNGSDPYQAPGILTSIANLEMNRGTFYPKEGMYQITDRLMKVADSLGVKFHFNAGVDKIIVEELELNPVIVDIKM